MESVNMFCSSRRSGCSSTINSLFILSVPVKPEYLYSQYNQSIYPLCPSMTSPFRQLCFILMSVLTKIEVQRCVLSLGKARVFWLVITPSKAFKRLGFNVPVKIGVRVRVRRFVVMVRVKSWLIYYAMKVLTKVEGQGCVCL